MTAEHPFVRAPQRTVLALAFPVLLSLIAEPLTGLVDTAFVARLGAQSLAALGVAASLLSSVFWIFNFLGIGSQTEVAKALGAARPERAAAAGGLALALAAVFGLLLAGAGQLAVGPAVRLMSDDPEVQAQAAVYLRIRLYAAPAVLLTTACFGALRGAQDMRSPLWIALFLNALNALLDALLIPRFGIAGAAWATGAAQYLGAVAAIYALSQRLGGAAGPRLRDAGRLLAAGGNLLLRTGLLTAFLLLATRTANAAGSEAGAAHQAIRQVWLLSALILDAYAAAAQSLVGYFLGAGRLAEARRVCAVAGGWSAATGLLLALGMLLCSGWCAALLVPPAARAAFLAAWPAAALFQPLNALAFLSDGIHWGTGDYGYLRNVMFVAAGTGGLLLLQIDPAAPHALRSVWLITGLWITLRAALGLLRVWPGIGRSPLRSG